MIEVEQPNKRHYEVNDAATIKVAVKNVEQLAVKVYALQQKNYYAQYGPEVDIDMNLDGLTANWVITKLRSRTVVIKELKDIVGNGNIVGVFPVDVVGNGKRARCCIRKGVRRRDQGPRVELMECQCGRVHVPATYAVGVLLILALLAITHNISGRPYVRFAVRADGRAIGRLSEAFRG